MRRTGGRADSSDAGKNPFSFPNLEFVPVTEEIPARARSLAEQFGATVRDATHCAPAPSTGIRTMVSGDRRLDVVSSARGKTRSAFVERPGRLSGESEKNIGNMRSPDSTPWLDDKHRLEAGRDLAQASGIRRGEEAAIGPPG